MHKNLENDQNILVISKITKIYLKTFKIDQNILETSQNYPQNLQNNQNTFKTSI